MYLGSKGIFLLEIMASGQVFEVHSLFMINFIIQSSIIVQHSSGWQVQSVRHRGTQGVQI